MLRARLESLAMADDSDLEAWKNAWDDVVAPDNTKQGTDLETDLYRPLARSVTDNVYFDAADQPFEHKIADENKAKITQIC